jgi:tetratricopeptide (TPR) repeat protein
MRRFSLLFLCLVLACLINLPEAEGSDTAVSAKALSHYIQAGIHERLNRLDEASAEYKAALKSDYHSPYIHLRLAVILLKQNQLAQAADELKLAIKYYGQEASESNQDASFIEAHTLLALVYSLQGQLDEATTEYEAALRGALAIDPQNIRIHKSLAQVYLRRNQFPEAEKTYRLILDIAPADSEAHFYLGSIYEQQGKRHQAIQEFKAALKLNPEFPDALNSLGYLYAEESINLQEAEDMLKKALTYQPDNGAYVDSLGWIYFKQGRYQEALEELEKAAGLLDDPVIYEHLGDAYLKQDNPLKAQEYWQKSLGINPSQDLRVKQKLEQIRD